MRNLATIRVVSEILPIEGADRIEIAKIDGWQCVVNKGDFIPGDSCFYFEIDSLLPVENPAFEFLKDKAKYRNSEGKLCHRLRTIKLRKQLSQGLALPINAFEFNEADTGLAYDEILGIEKYEPPIPGSLAGKVKGNFPSFIPKTDQERVQNLWKDIQASSDTYEVSIKLDGSSMTVYRRGDEFGVCSRNWDLEETDDNLYWIAARLEKLEEKLKSLGEDYDNIALQGELIGPGIQGNNEKLNQIEFRVFDVWDFQELRYLPSEERLALCEMLDIKHVPLLQLFVDGIALPDDLNVLLKIADGPSMNPKSMREGLVFKSLEDPLFSFKVISNEYLLKHGDR